MSHTLLVKKLDPNAKLPTRAFDKSVGWDLYALGNYTICPGDTVAVRTGLAIRIDNHGDTTNVGLVWDRSSLGSKGIHRLAGVIDIDEYNGEWKICLTNLNIYNLLWEYDPTDQNSLSRAMHNHAYRINNGDKIAQVLIQSIVHTSHILEVDELPESQRGEGGFGSSGKH